MKNLILVICLATSIFKANAQNSLKQEQDSLKSNPIIFSDVLFGGAFGRAGGGSFSPSINYQKGNLLFTARYLASAKFFSESIPNNWLFPFIRNTYFRSVSEEFSLLAGYRYLVGSGSSLSFSSGISRTKYKYYGEEGNDPEFRDYYLGLPFEASFTLFNQRKERFRIYGLIPVGRPVGLSNSIGVKLYGNLSRNSFVGLGLNLGYGFYKKY